MSHKCALIGANCKLATEATCEGSCRGESKTWTSICKASFALPVQL